MLLTTISLLTLAGGDFDLALEAPRRTPTRVQRVDWSTPEDDCCSASQLSVMPLGAENCWVTVGELDLGYAPFFRKAVPAGECITRVQCEDGRRWSGKVTLRPGASERVLIRAKDWEPTPKTSRLSLIALGETRCHATLGKRDLGKLPFFDREVPEGPWSVTVRCKSGHKYTQRLDLEAGHHHRVMVGAEEWSDPPARAALTPPPRSRARS